MEGVRCTVYKLFASANQCVLNRELDEDDWRAEELEDVSRSDDCSASTDVPVGIMRCLARPPHALTEERAPGCLRPDNSRKIGFVNDTNGISAALDRFQEEHIITAGYLRMQILFARQPHLAFDNEVSTGTHDRPTLFSRPHGQFLNGGIFSYL